VDRRRSGRCYIPIVDLPFHEGLEPSSWRLDPEFGGRSIFVWSSQKPGVNLSMNRRPDGTFVGNLTAEQKLFEQLKTKEDAERLLRSAFRGVPEEFVGFIAEQVSLQCSNLKRSHWHIL
jgi:hypothetical protein